MGGRCVRWYEVAVCPEGGGHCQEHRETVEAEEDTATSTLSPLPHSTTFTVHITPVHPSNPPPLTTSTFHTAVPLASLAVTATATEEGLVELDWTDVAIATEYLVLRREEEGEWEQVAATGEVGWSQPEVRCRRVQYGVTVVVGEGEYGEEVEGGGRELAAISALHRLGRLQ